MFCSCKNNDTVEIIGLSNISTFVLATTNPVWTEISVPEVLNIPTQKPDVESVEKVILSVKITSTKLIVTPNSYTFANSEGTKLTGNKVIVEGELSQKVFYTADERTQSVHTANFSNLFSAYIVVQPTDTTVEYMVDVCVEDVFVKTLNTREIFESITLLLSASLPVPIVSSGVVLNTGLEIDLTMTSPLAATTPANTAFTISILGTVTVPTVDTVVVSGTTVALTLTGGIIKAGDVITLAYTVPPTNPLTGLDGNIVADFSGKPIVNNSTPPSVSSGSVIASGLVIDLIMTSLLTSTSIANNAFTITSSGTAPTVTNVTFSSTTVTMLALAVSPAINLGDVITLAYTAPGTNNLTSSNGDVYSFANQAITNNSTV